MERVPKKHVVQEYEDFDYRNLYDDTYVSTVTAGPNVTEYEVRLSRKSSITLCLVLLITICLRACLSDRSSSTKTTTTQPVTPT